MREFFNRIDRFLYTSALANLSSTARCFSSKVRLDILKVCLTGCLQNCPAEDRASGIGGSGKRVVVQAVDRDNPVSLIFLDFHAEPVGLAHLVDDSDNPKLICEIELEIRGDDVAIINDPGIVDAKRLLAIVQGNPSGFLIRGLCRCGLAYLIIENVRHQPTLCVAGSMPRASHSQSNACSSV